MSGRGAEARFRHEGKVVSKEAFDAAAEAKLAAKKRQPKYLEEEVAWSGGLAQQRAQAEAREAVAREVWCYCASVAHTVCGLQRRCGISTDSVRVTRWMCTFSVEWGTAAGVATVDKQWALACNKTKPARAHCRWPIRHSAAAKPALSRNETLFGDKQRARACRWPSRCTAFQRQRCLQVAKPLHRVSTTTRCLQVAKPLQRGSDADAFVT